MGLAAPLGFTTWFNLDGLPPDNVHRINCRDASQPAVGIGELAALQALFSSYRIRKVRVDFRITQTEFTDNVYMPVITYRYNYDPNKVVTPGGGLAQMDSSTDIKQHMFTNESPMVSATIYPKVLAPLYAVSGLTADGYGLSSVSPPWMDLSTTGHGAASSVPHLGLDVWMNNLPSGQYLYVDVEFDVEFKWQH